MRVGFTITGLKLSRSEAIEYLKTICILDTPEMAENIVDYPYPVNVFTQASFNMTAAAFPFHATPIETVTGRTIVASAVNFLVEFYLGNTLHRLKPTQYLSLTTSEVNSLSLLIKQGLLVTLPR